MKKRARRILSVLLALTMILSHADLSFAQDLGAKSSAAASGSKELELIATDPARLGIKKLGEVEESESEEQAEESLYGPDDIVRVSIFLNDPGAYDAGFKMNGVSTNAAAISYQETLRRNQDAVTARINAATGRAIEVKWNLTLLTNAISANVRYGDLDQIRALAGVKSVELEQQYAPAVVDKGGEPDSPFMTSARDMVGANSGNATKYKGAGSKLAVIDTGLDTAHQSFDADAFDHAIAEDEAESGITYDLLTQEEVNAIKSQLNGRTGIYISSKIPFAYNYVDNNTTVNHESDTQEEHGSHVSGIAAANRYIKKGSEYQDAASTVKVVGEAPDAQIFVMKVFGSGGGAYDSDYFAAVEDAVRLGASSANLSLGSSLPGIATQTASSYLTILNNLKSSELVLSVSMGNNTSWDSQKQLYADDVNLMTGGSPGSFNNSFTVASVDDSGTGLPLVHFGSIDSRYDEMGGAEKKMLPEIAGTYEFIYLDTVGYTDGGDTYNERYDQFNTLKDLVAGKVALCNRGTSSFFLKANSAMKAGAVALIVVNNQPGSMSSTSVAGYTYTNPVVGIKQSVGEEIKAAFEMQTAEGINYYTGSVKIDGSDETTPLEYYEMSDFSSWGVTGALTLKPEITAPGGSVLSLNGYHRNATGGGYSGGHDQYELMSGTSMAAPQITGLSAAIGQYYRDNGIQEKTGLSARHFALSQFMATAVPIKEEESGNYYSLLKQGAGLANLEAAVDAKSYIKMAESATLTASDYKVKAELGDDPTRSGLYTYAFEIHNFSEAAIEYSLKTDVFTQALSADKTLMEHITTPVEASVAYAWDAEPGFAADVNKDGITDEADADAILSYITGENDGSTYDLSAAEQDGVEGISSRDAYALLKKLEETAEETHIVPAGGSRTVTVTIRLSDAQKEQFNAERAGGAYVEAFTFIESENDVTYSIPVLGFYGSWTDASMFDAANYAEDTYYASGQTSYFNASNTNQVLIRYNGSTVNTAFIGNPYIKEAVFPEERLALNSAANIYQIRYGLIRPTAGAAFAAVKDGEILYAASPSANQNAAYYNTQSSTPSWQNTNVSSTTANRTVSSLGVAENDQFTFGYFAFPEYYTYQANGTDQTFALTSAQFQKILKDGNFGKGAYIGYTVTVDDTAPVIGEAAANDDGTVSIVLSDNQYVACLKVMDIAGRKVFLNVVPEQSAAGSTITYTFDPAEYGIGNACTVFAADYAGNETATIVRLADGPIEIERAIYRLTSTLEAGKNYLIVNSNAAGSTTRYALSHSGASVARDDVIIAADATGNYIDDSYVDAASVWTAEEGFKFINDGRYMRTVVTTSSCFTTVSLTFDETDSANIWSWNGTNNRLSTSANNRTYYLRYSGSSFSLATGNNSVYLYVEETYTEVIDPEAVSSVTVTPDQLSIYTGNTAQLQVEVLPVTATNKSVVWSTSDPQVATVDENGFVTAVGGGTATITATSVSNEAVSGSCAVTVTAVTAMPGASINAQLANDGGVNFVKIDLGNLSTTVLGTAAGTHYGGGRSDEFIVGFDSSNQGNVYMTVIGEDGSYSSALLGSFGTSTYNSRDGAHIPVLFAEYEGETLIEYYHSLYFASGYLLLFDASAGSITGWNASGYSALTYIGTDPETFDHYYYALDSQGRLVPMMIGLDEDEPVALDDTGAPALNLALGTGSATAISGLSSSAGTFGANYMSMSLIDTKDYYGLLIANSNNQRIYFVDLTGTTLSATLVAGFSGATSLTTLYNDDYDASIIGLDMSGAAQIERMKANIAASGNPVVKAEKLASLAKETEETVPEEVTEAPEEPAEAPAEVTEAAEEPTEAPAEVTEAPEITEEAPAEPEVPAEETEAPEEEAPAEPEEPAEETEAPEEEAPAEPEEPAEEAEEAAEEPEEEISEEEPEAEPAPEAAGGLNGILVKALVTGQGDPVAVPQAVSGTPGQGEDNMVTVSLKEDVAVTNGYIYMNFGKPELAFVKAESDLAHYSVFQEKDEIVFAYASAETIPADTVLVTLFFETDCDENPKTLSITTRERDTELSLSEAVSVNAPSLPHAWAAPTWSWTGTDPEYTAATATFVCKNNEQHVKELTDSDLDYEVTLEPTTEATGKAVYTASVELDGETFTDTKEVTLPKIGFRIIVTDYTDGKATTSIIEDELYFGEVTFTVSEETDQPCLVAVESADGTSYTRLVCTTAEGVHSFTINVEAEVKLALVYKGDVNLDGTVSSRDANQISKYLVKTGELDALQMVVADTNEDGSVTSKDSNRISKVLVETAVFVW